MAFKKCFNGEVSSCLIFLILYLTRYRFKEAEAQWLSDFLLPMLDYSPDKRATAQKMLDHPFLSMPSNFDFKMTDREYEKMTMFKKNWKTDKKSTIRERDVVESDVEQNEADFEELNDLEVDDDDDNAEPTDTINIQNFNNSFAIYWQHVKLSALDKANPQFN